MICAFSRAFCGGENIGVGWGGIGKRGFKWGQVSSSGFKWVILRSSESSQFKLVQVSQMSSSESMWVQVSSSEFKWVQVSSFESSDFKWIQLGTSEFKWIHMSPSEFERFFRNPTLLLWLFCWSVATATPKELYKFAASAPLFRCALPPHNPFVPGYTYYINYLSSSLFLSFF